MNENTMPELTLTPDTATAAAQAPEAPTLTLEPTLSTDDAQAAQAAAQAERDKAIAELSEAYDE